MNRSLQAGSLAVALSLSASAIAMTILIQADQPGADMNPAMWGIFFEDINFGADGGLFVYSSFRSGSYFFSIEHLMHSS